MNSLSNQTDKAYQTKHWKRRNYHRIDSATTHKKRVKIVRLGGGLRHKQWRIRANNIVIKLRLIKMASPLKLLRKLKSAYVRFVLNFTGHDSSQSGKLALKGPISTPEEDLVNKQAEMNLVYQIFKSLAVSHAGGSLRVVG